MVCYRVGVGVKVVQGSSPIIESVQGLTVLKWTSYFRGTRELCSWLLPSLTSSMLFTHAIENYNLYCQENPVHPHTSFTVIHIEKVAKNENGNQDETWIMCMWCYGFISW